MNLEITVGKVKLANPVLVASGTFGFGCEYDQAFPVRALGGVVSKSVTLKPRAGNRPPRIVETPSGLINSIGLENPGIERALEEQLPKMVAVADRAIVSVAGDSPEDYAELCKRLNGATGICAIELNLSCPNVYKGGLLIGVDPAAVAQTVRLCREATSLPLWAKLTPNVTDIVELAAAAMDNGADAVVLINTLRAMAIDIQRRRPVLGNVYGGLSGPAIKPVALRAVWDVYQALGCDIIGSGGVCTVDDALEFIAAGAMAVSVGTALFVDPRCPWRIIEELPGRLRTLGVDSIVDWVGVAHERGEH